MNESDSGLIEPLLIKEFKLKTRLLLFMFFALPLLASAELLNCGESDVKRIVVLGDREGTHAHENKLLVELYNNGVNVSCAGMPYVYMDFDNPAYSSVLSMLLSAQTTGKKVQVSVNTTVKAASNGVEISYISLSM
jgi:hypothetical protein